MAAISFLMILTRAGVVFTLISLINYFKSNFVNTFLYAVHKIHCDIANFVLKTYCEALARDSHKFIGDFPRVNPVDVFRTPY